MQLSLDLYRVMTPYYQYRVAFFVITLLLNHIKVAFWSIWSISSCLIQFDPFQCTYIIMIIDKFGLRAVAAPLVCEGGHMTTLTCQIFYFILFFLYLANIYIYICKDQIRLESKTGMDPGPRSPNNEFVECRKES